jgi:hypothetical protein
LLSDIETAPTALSNAEPSSTGSVPSFPSFIERARATHSRAWARWTRDEDARLTLLFHQGMSRAALVRELGRQPGAVRSRLLKLGLISDADDGDATVEDAAPNRPDSGETQEQAERREQAGHATPSSVVPGWEAFRDRLSPDRETV